MNIVESGIENLRDPFILEEDGVLYAYGSGWVCHRNATGCLDSGWESAKMVVEIPDENDFAGDYWAPEVHRYGNAYYMFTTYRSKESGHRGCTVFRADDPMGPFRTYSQGHITPRNWDSIDATLYVDEAGDPWVVFVHEWTCTDDGIGRFAVARLSRDLKMRVSEPVEIFRADSFGWASNMVTDGCWMHRTRQGSLLMLWSSAGPDGGYAVGIARSASGNVEGPWVHDSEMYSKTISGGYDGGHGMLFSWKNQLWLSIHSPNSPAGYRKEMPVFVPVIENKDTLICQ